MSASRIPNSGAGLRGRSIAPALRRGATLTVIPALLALIGCGTATPETPQPGNGGAEVTVILPPAVPPASDTEKAATPAGEQRTEDAPAIAAAAQETEASAGPAETALVAAPPPLALPSLGRYIRGAGFACDEVVASRQLERDGNRVGIYRFDCGSGQSYQGTMRQNHLYFREWRGVPAG